MRDIPLDVFLSFPLPNYKNPPTRGPALVIVNAILIALVVVAVLLRLYARLFIKRWFGSDDIFIILALISTVGLTVVVILANQHFGWNRHVWDVPLDLLPSAGKIAFAAKIVFTLAATFTRLSLLCFYFRLVQDSGVAWFRRVLHASMAFVVAICIAFVALVIWQCNPIESYWVFPPMPNSKCLDEGKVTLAAGVINCVADLLVTTLPIPIVMKLQMPIRQRIGVIFLLSLGFIVTIAGVVRTYYIWKSLIDSYDETWFSYPLWICAAVEIDLAVLCACAPALRPLLLQVLGPSISTLNEKITNLVASRSNLNSPNVSNQSKSTAQPTLVPSSQPTLLGIADDDVGFMKRQTFEMKAVSSQSREAFVRVAERERDEEDEIGWERPATSKTYVQSWSREAA